jgi:hypothetical protein
MGKTSFGGAKPGLLSVAYQSRLGLVSNPPSVKAARQASAIMTGIA